MTKARGLQLPREGRRQRPVDCGPLFSADVDRGVGVRVRAEATSLAKELRLRTTVGLLTMAALATRPAGIPGVYQM